MSHALGSSGCCRGHTSTARMSASCTASSAVAKSAPRRTSAASTPGISSRSRDSSSGAIYSVTVVGEPMNGRTSSHS
jgi:hypothetical protein